MWVSKKCKPWTPVFLLCKKIPFNLYISILNSFDFTLFVLIRTTQVVGSFLHKANANNTTFCGYFWVSIVKWCQKQSKLNLSFGKFYKYPLQTFMSSDFTSRKGSYTLGSKHVATNATLHWPYHYYWSRGTIVPCKAITIGNVMYLKSMIKIVFKDTLKAFDDFKKKPKGYEVIFLLCKSMYILKLYLIQYTLR